MELTALTTRLAVADAVSACVQACFEREDALLAADADADADGWDARAGVAGINN